MNVLFFTSWYPTRKLPYAGVFVREHAKAVRDAGHRVVVLHLAGPRPEEGSRLWTMEEELDPSLSEGIESHHVFHRRSGVRGASYLLYLWSALAAYRRLRGNGFQPDVIHGHVYGAGVPAALIGAQSGIPVVLTEHFSGFPRRTLGGAEARKARFAYRRAARALPVSRHLRDAIRSYGIEARFEVVPNVVDTSLFSPAGGEERSGDGVERRLLFVGDPSELKGFPTLLQALARLERRGHAWQLDVIGDGPERADCEASAVALALRDRVIFHGFRSKPDIAQAMRTADLLVLPSRVETFGAVIAEALASGLPVVSTSAGGIPELVDERSGRLARPDDPAGFADALEDALENLHAFDRTAIAAAARARFSPGIVGEQLTEIYESVLAESRAEDDQVPAEGSIRHILVVAYLYPPCNVVPAHRPAGLHRAFRSAGIRTTVLTSEISGSYEDDDAQRIIRAGDLRTRFQTQYQTLVGYREGPLEARAKPRWWTNYIVPDPTALAWFPQALVHLLRLIQRDRPDLVITTSGPESSHLLGLVARAFGIRWVADYRDGWLRDVRHPAPLRPIDRLLERLVARRSTVVTAVNDAIASEVSQRHGVRAFTISNGFDRDVVADATDERATVDPARFSLVYTGVLAIDANETVIHRGKDARTLLDALRLLLARDSGFATRLELVVAGPVSDHEREVLTHAELGSAVRVLGLLPRERALGLQHAADGLLLIPGGAGATTAKIFEYLAACKPIFAVTEQESVAADLLREAGEHTVAEGGDPESLAAALEAYLTRWTTGAAYEPRSTFDLDAYEYGSLGQKLLRLVTAAGSEPTRR